MMCEIINSDEALFSLDIGTRTVIGTVGVVRDKKFHVISEKFVEHEERAMIDGQIHDINLVARAVNKVKSEIEEELSFKLERVAIAAAGRFLRTTTVKSQINIDEDKEIDKELIRSLELTAVKLAEEEVNKNTVGKLYCVGYSVKNYFLNGYAISNLSGHKGQNITAEVIATFLPRSVVDSLYAVTKKVGLSVTNLTLEPIAAMEAAIPQNLRLLNLALVDVGAGTSDIAISSNETISAYGMVSMAGDKVTEAIAKACLLDFNGAEKVKKQINEQKEVTYVDVLGIENKITYDEIIKIVTPVSEKLSEEIANKIIELNGGKAPNAVFLVGGGAHTLLLKELLAKKLNIPDQRIAIKGREAVTDCVCEDNNLGSTGVTVLGIALVAIKKYGGDFIDVFLNNGVVSLFNSKKNTVMDVIMQAGINPKVLIARNGNNIRFTLNGDKRVAFGKVGKSAVIKINGLSGSIESDIRENDKIEIEFSLNGENAKAAIKDYVKNVDTIGFYLNDEVENLEPIFIANGDKRDINYEIVEGDELKTIFPKTIGEYRQYINNNENLEYFMNDEKIADDYIIKEGDKIYSKEKVELKEKIEADIKNHESGNSIQNSSEISSEGLNEEQVKYETIDVVVNDKRMKLSGKKQYIFVDIFNHIDFDLTTLKGRIILKLNGENAGYSNDLKDGDVIEVRGE
jgi:cell division protein FtsA